MLFFCQGALVPLSDEVIEHLQLEGCNVLAERLALFSGASVKMINGMNLYTLCIQNTRSGEKTNSLENRLSAFFFVCLFFL